MYIKKILYHLSAITLFGCSNFSTDSISVENKITYYYQDDSIIQQNEYLTIWIKNESNICVIFPPDFGAKIFVNMSGQVVEVPNKMKVIGDQSWMLDPNNELSLESPLNIRPDILALSLSVPTDFYVTIEGTVCDSSSQIIKKSIPFTILP